MSTLTAILEPQPDGTLHLPIPNELRDGKVKVVATFERAECSKPKSSRKAGSMKGTVWMAPDFDAPLEDFKEYME
jgi:hypothetical protein